MLFSNINLKTDLRLCVVLSANGVSPTKTVILMHASTPCVVLGSK